MEPNGFKNKLDRAIWHVPRRLASDETPSGSDDRFKSLIITTEQQYRSVGVHVEGELCVVKMSSKEENVLLSPITPSPDRFSSR